MKVGRGVRARALALGLAVVAVAVVVIVVLTGGGSPYRVRLLFSDASGLVGGDRVMIGPSAVGSVGSIRLTARGQAAVEVTLSAGAAPLYRGTVARIEDNGLAGIASHYVTLQPAAPRAGGQIPSGGTISSRDTHAEVGLDQLFNAFNGATRKGLANIIRGEATSISGKTAAANRTLVYLDPLLQSTSQVTAALHREEPAFDQLLVKGAETMQALSSRSQQLTDLVSRSDAVTGTVASQSAALAQTLELLPSALSESTTTFTGLRKTIAALEPLVAATKPQVKQLTPFATALNDFATTAVPTLTELAKLISNSGGGNLITLLREAPALESAASSGFAAIVASLQAQTSSGQIQALREYTPDIVAALANVGQLDGYYDANGHYGRAEPFYGAYGISGGELTDNSPADRYRGLTVVSSGRCPGSATASADASMPVSVSGCDTANKP